MHENPLIRIVSSMQVHTLTFELFQMVNGRTFFHDDWVIKYMLYMYLITAWYFTICLSKSFRHVFEISLNEILALAVVKFIKTPRDFINFLLKPLPKWTHSLKLSHGHQVSDKHSRLTYKCKTCLFCNQTSLYLSAFSPFSLQMFSAIVEPDWCNWVWYLVSFLRKCFHSLLSIIKHIPIAQLDVFLFFLFFGGGVVTCLMAFSHVFRTQCELLAVSELLRFGNLFL